MKEIFLYIGITGFLSVFQAVGCGLGLAAYWHIRKTRKTKFSDLPGLFFGALFMLFFIFGPLTIAHEYGGWPLTGFQFVVVAVLLTFTFFSGKKGYDLQPSNNTSTTENPEQPIVPDLGEHFRRALPGSLLCFYLAAAYGAVLLGTPLPMMDEEWLEALVKIEFLVIHSLPFMALITLIPFGHRHWRYFQWFLFITWYCLYLGFAMEIRDHPDALIAFSAATAGTYLSFMLQKSGEHRVVLAFKRWGICLALFVLVSSVVGAKDWRFTGPMIKLGLLYFLLIGLVELTPIYRIHWRRWLEGKLKRFKAES